MDSDKRYERGLLLRMSVAALLTELFMDWRGSLDFGYFARLAVWLVVFSVVLLVVMAGLERR